MLGFVYLFFTMVWSMFNSPEGTNLESSEGPRPPQPDRPPNRVGWLAMSTR